MSVLLSSRAESPEPAPRDEAPTGILAVPRSAGLLTEIRVAAPILLLLALLLAPEKVQLLWLSHLQAAVGWLDDRFHS